MLRYVLSRGCVGGLLAVLLVSGCAVETPRPAPSGPPAVSVPPNQPPEGAMPAPKTYSGSYADRLEAAARDALVDSPVHVLRNGATVKLIVPANAAFGIHSAQLQPRFSAVLDTIAQLCRDYSQTAIAVKGFTDSTGSFEHNQQLSAQRAQNIGAYLLYREIAATRIHTAGYGPRYPIADNRTDEGRLQNRRVEIDMMTAP